jgi:hypothetical protein
MEEGKLFLWGQHYPDNNYNNTTKTVI